MSQARRAPFRPLILASLIIVSAAASASTAQGTSVEPVCAVPDRMREALTSRFGSSRILQKSDLYQDERELFARDRGDACPGLVTGRFFSATERPATAIVLLDVGSEKRVRVVVARPATSTWVFHEAGDFETGTTAILRRAAPGRYADAEGTRAMETKQDVLLYVGYEAWTRAFIWTAGKFESFRLKD